jgi:membrane protein DedA with SNARE-associated domain
MKCSQFGVWHFIASLLFTLSVAATAYGFGRVTTGHHPREVILSLIAGLVMSAVMVAVLVRRRRRHKVLVAVSAAP